jgi:uncharacterized membrane protein YgdD (TMEM256/DUF423 family)
LIQRPLQQNLRLRDVSHLRSTTARHATQLDMTNLRIAAALCFLAVALGAFGAHALKSTLESYGMLDVWNKAVLYHFIHAIALFALGLYGVNNRGAWWLILAGVVLFSGSLYVMALTNLRWLGTVTPLGGLCFLAGWGWLILWPPR